MGAIVTSIGQAKIADAIANSTDIELARLLVGDGNGNTVTPVESMTALVNQVYDIQVTSVTRDETNTNWIIVEATIPEVAGPFYIREIGIEDSDGQLFAVSDYPVTQKFVAGEGVATAITVRTILVVSDTANVTVVLQPSDYVPASRRIDTGDGLTGGGDLTQDREIEIDWNTLPTSDTVANEDTIAVRKAADGSHVQMSREDFIGEAILSGDGLTGGSNVGTGDGQLVKGVTGTNLTVRKVKAGAGITVSTDTTNDDVVVNQADYGLALTAGTFDPATNKIVTASTGNPASEALLDSRVSLAKVLASVGLADVQFGNSAPGDNTKLWWHTAVDTLKRYNPLTGAWAALSETQFALWLYKKRINSAAAATVIADADEIGLYQASSGEGKKITGANLRETLRGGWVQVGSTQTVSSPTAYVEFTLPVVFHDVLLTVDTYRLDLPGGGTTVQPLDVDSFYVGGGAGPKLYDAPSNFTENTDQELTVMLSGDNHTNTGRIFRASSSRPPTLGEYVVPIPVTARVEKVRLQSPTATALITQGTFKLFVR